MFFPPVIFLTLLANFLIDSLVIVICFYLYKLVETNLNLKDFYKRSILKVWLYGFLADMIGAAILFAAVMGENLFGLSNELVTAINFDPFSHPLAIVIVISAILVAAIFIFIFNYKYTFENLIAEKSLKFKMAITVALLTMPWTFLLPTKWLY